MSRTPILGAIQQFKKPVFTTFELVALSGKSASAVTQGLNNLLKTGFLSKIYRGVWMLAGSGKVSPYTVVPYLLPRQRAYVSFISALHLHGIIEQIPQVVTVASLTHTKTMRTAIGVFAFHRITPVLFSGFSWYNEDGSFLIAEPEKALVDSLYLSACRKRQFGHFPELHFPKQFDFKKAYGWAAIIPNVRVRAYVKLRLDEIKRSP